MMTTLEIKLSALQVLGLAAFGLVMGVWGKRRLPLLDRLNIPASVLGGLIYAAAALALRDRVVNFEMEMVLRDVLMVAFFTTVGMSASLRLVKQGGRQVLTFLLLAATGIVLENLLAVAAGALVGLKPLAALLAGSVSMAGGPATAIAFGGTFEKLGVEGATSVALGAAIYGIVAGGLLGGFVGGRLVGTRPRADAPHDAHPHPATEMVYGGDPQAATALRLKDESIAERSPLLNNVVALAIAMGLGTLISRWLEQLGMVLPSYIGAMICAGIVRNLDDTFGFARISQQRMDEIGGVSLDLFIVMALLTLRLWELTNLAGPVIVILAMETMLVVLLARYVVFRVMGSDYEAAVISAGFCGFMLGTTANALACMGEVVHKWGNAPRAFLVVSLVGAFLIDFVNALVITQFATFFR